MAHSQLGLNFKVYTVIPPLFSVLFSAAFVTCCQPQSKILNENFRIKQFLSFKLCAVLRSVIKSHSVPLCSIWDAHHPLCPGHPTRWSFCSHLDYQTRSALEVSQCLCSSNPYFTYQWPPKLRTSDAGNSQERKRNCKMLPLSEKVKVPNLIRR